MNFSSKHLNRNELIREEGNNSIGNVTQFDFSEFRERDW
jgi:hypothetical protein